MEKTLSDLVAEVERLVKPLGLKIHFVERWEKGDTIIKDPSKEADISEIRITVSCKGVFS
jgi:hypothetical protein